MASNASTIPTLTRLDPDAGCAFAVPAKRINDGDDVTFFLASKAYADIMTFLFQLNTAMVPRRQSDSLPAREWALKDPDVALPPIVQNLAKLLQTLAAIIDEAPPDPGPRRFGNISFRKWHEIVQERVPQWLRECLPTQVLDFKSTSTTAASAELEAYFNGSFGSSQRLDYGTGHELSFLAFLACLWKLGAFADSKDGDMERAIVLGVIEPYLALIRRLILTYTLEPAGSHGVWGLDDHAFLPYILGSAQFSPAITAPADIVTEGSLPTAPNPADVTKASVVERERQRNMYFSAIGFIYDVKKGPFWEHSPILYDISGIKAGWAKINKGMIKMYNAEVLSKFPVVQHFPFASLLPWTPDPSALKIKNSIHISSQPKSLPNTFPSPTPSAASRLSRDLRQNPPLRGPVIPMHAQSMVRDPMAAVGQGGTVAPWARGRAEGEGGGRGEQVTRAPWAKERGQNRDGDGNGDGDGDVATMAPWAKK